MSAPRLRKSQSGWIGALGEKLGENRVFDYHETTVL
jgi:hypothetical protein